MEDGVQSSSTVVFSPGESDAIFAVSTVVLSILSETSKAPASPEPIFSMVAVIGLITSFRRLSGVLIVVTVRSGCVVDSVVRAKRSP